MSRWSRWKHLRRLDYYQSSKQFPSNRQLKFAVAIQIQGVKSGGQVHSIKVVSGQDPARNHSHDQQWQYPGPCSGRVHILQMWIRIELTKKTYTLKTFNHLTRAEDSAVHKSFHLQYDYLGSEDQQCPVKLSFRKVLKTFFKILPWCLKVILTEKRKNKHFFFLPVEFIHEF